MTRRRTVTRTVRLHPAQLAFRRSSALYRGFVGGVGSGKSWAGAFDLLVRSRPGCLYMATAPTYTMLEDSTLRSFLAVATQLALFVDLNRSRLVARLGEGREVLFRSTDDPDRLRGPNLSDVWMDEASLSDREAFHVLIGRLRQHGRQGGLSATFTPKGLQHWTYDVFGKVPAPRDTALFRARTDENPFNPPGFADTLRRHYPSELVPQELGGEFMDLAGARFRRAWFRHSWRDTGGAWMLDRTRLYLQRDCQVIVVCDPAASEKQSADWTVCAAFALTPANDLLVLEVDRARLPVDAIVPRLAAVCRRWQPAGVWVEATGFQVALVREARRTPGMPPVGELSPQSRSKLVRATEAILRAEAGQVFLPEAAPWLDAFLAEVLAFTGQDDAFDDQVDCLAYAALIQSRKLDMARQGGKPYVIGSTL